MRDMGSRVEEILLRKKQREARLHSSLRLVVRQLREMGALRIVLMGSLARGDVGPHSDIDLLVVMPPSKSGREWAGLVYGKLERGVASDIAVFNQEEYERDLPVSRFLRQAARSGRVLYEKAA